MGLAAVVLAAGASTRMGRPKALIGWRGQTFLRRVVGLAEAAGCAPIVVVEGALTLPEAELGPAIRALNRSWSEGQLSSLQVGLRGLTSTVGPGCSGVMVLAIDRPRVAAATCRALREYRAVRDVSAGVYHGGETVATGNKLVVDPPPNLGDRDGADRVHQLDMAWVILKDQLV